MSKSKSKSKTTKTKPAKLELSDLHKEVTQMLFRYHDAGCCPGCVAEVLFKSAIAMAATAGEVCWTKDHPEEIEAIDTLVRQVISRSVGVPPGATLH